MSGVFKNSAVNHRIAAPKIFTHCCCAFVVSLLFISSGAAADSWWQVLSDKSASKAEMISVRQYLQREAEASLARRDSVLETLRSPAEIASYQRELREFLWKQLGGRPKSTPLNARITGSHAGERFRVENLIYESSPQFFVTANLYLPTSSPPYPAVLIPCGHTTSGKGYGSYQRMGMLLARNGIAALCYDPIGQGERYQILDKTGKPVHKSTNEHTMVGIGSALVGRNCATYRVYDGVRSLDYLCRRDDIDATKLGCTGSSGGGTLTEYLMALDERIVAAAPACCVTSWRRRLLTIGPGDAEQNVAGQIAGGLDHGDYAIIRAPRPTLLCAATRDFVDIQGSWDIFRETNRIYTRLGFSERIDLVEVDSKHGYPSAMRVAIARWMLRWLKDIDKPIEELEVETLTAEQIQCTPKGQALLLPKAKSVMDLNVELNEQLARSRAELWRVKSGDAIEKVRSLIGARSLSELPGAKSELVGTIDKSSYRIEKRIVTGPNDIPLPGLLFVPKEAIGNPVLYLNGLGKHEDAEVGGEIEKLVLAGRTVFAVDLSGTGETGGGATGQWGGDFDNIFVAYLVAKSTVGIRTEDVWHSTRFLARHSKTKKIDLVAKHVASIPALHAAALERDLFGKVDIDLPFKSWTETLTQPSGKGQLIHMVHGALEVYDLPELSKHIAAFSSNK
jgi:cephalosporin-C deacetylase-like acetyl esterase